jgi:DNA-binding transcriptional LysR family regulator
MIRFRQIEAFRHLIISGTVTGAAKRLQISQPAISRMIADLESEVGFPLFAREKGRLETTVAGMRFYRAVEENFLGLERLMQVADLIRSDATEILNIACLPAMSTTLLPQVLTAFLKRYPEVRVRVDVLSMTEILYRLQDLKTDLALSLDFSEIAGIATEPIFKLNALCAMPENHPLAARAEITPEDLEGQNVIGWMPNGALQRTEQSILDNAEIRSQFNIETHHSLTRYAMVANGLGISIVEPFAAQVWRPLGVVVRPFHPAPSYGYVLAYPRAGLRTSITLAFREVLLEVVKVFDFKLS